MPHAQGIDGPPFVGGGPRLPPPEREPDDALRPPVGAVRLDSRHSSVRRTPSRGRAPHSPGRTRRHPSHSRLRRLALSRRVGLSAAGPRAEAEGKVQDIGTGFARPGREVGEGHVHPRACPACRPSDRTTRFITVGVPPRAAGRTRPPPRRPRAPPSGTAAVDLLTVEFEDLGAPGRFGPLVGASNALPARHDQGIGQGIGPDLLLACSSRRVPLPLPAGPGCPSGRRGR